MRLSGTTSSALPVENLPDDDLPRIGISVTFDRDRRQTSESGDIITTHAIWPSVSASGWNQNSDEEMEVANPEHRRSGNH